MKVILAEHMGLCFGVRDALTLARAIQCPTQVTVFGQLVHNPLVNRELAARGFDVLEETDRSERTATRDEVLITAHGVSERLREQLSALGKKIHDSTCPLVRKAHAAARRLQKEGRFVLVIGKKGHVEVRGLTGDLPEGAFDVVENVSQVRCYPAARLGIMAQTTAVEREVRGIVERVREWNPAADVRFMNTVCQPTRDRQAALEALLAKVDVLVVVGGRASNNTRQLVSRTREAGVRAVHVEAADELTPEMFHTEEIVGLTAGTSTLPETVREVHRQLQAFYSEKYMNIEGAIYVSDGI